MKADELREVVIGLGRPAAVLEPADDRNLRLCARVIKLQSVERWNAVLQQANCFIQPLLYCHASDG